MNKLIALAVVALGLLAAPAFAQLGAGGVAGGGSAAGATSAAISTGVAVAAAAVVGVTVESATNDDEETPGTNGTSATGTQ